MIKKLLIYDTTLRDGEQAPGFSMSVNEKLMMARQLIDLGVDIIEAGYPAASGDDLTAVREIAGLSETTCISALSRCIEEEIYLTWTALKNASHPLLHLFIPSSDIQIFHQLKKNRTDAITLAKKSVEYAVALGVRIQFSAMDATRADTQFLHELLLEVINAGASVVNISDTTGFAIPREIYDLITGLRNTVIRDNDALFSIHCHNDLGLAVANTISAITADIDQVEVTVNGIGERAGNASLEEIITILEVRKDLFQMQTSVKKELLIKTSRLLSQITGINVHPCKPVVGENTVTHH